ncbi:MAG TPA: type II secretion system protein [Gammaproteobacteria bacterium]|nr:type II secretion system protein [Gammaproteobacteria bacterium]
MNINFLDKNSGFTLVELVISMTIISIAILGTLLAINTATRFSGDPLISTQAIAIAESYIEEILGKNFQSPTVPAAAAACPSTVLTRANFNDICNYNGLNQAPTDQNGNAIPELSGYTVQVAVDRQTAALGALVSGTQVVRIDVTVSHTSMTGMTFSVYRTNY